MKKIIITEKVKSGLLKTAFAMVLLGFTFYVLYHFISGYSSEVVTTEAKRTTVGVSETAEGYIFRNETVLYSKYDGTRDYYVTDGELVRVDTPLLKAYESNTGDNVAAQRAVIDAKIAALRAANVKGQLSLSDADKTEKAIKELYFALLSDIKSNGCYDAARHSEELLCELNKLAIYSGEENGFDGEIAALEAERSALSSLFTGQGEEVISPVGGYFFYGADGFEEAFSVGDDAETYFSEMTLSSFAAAQSSVPKSIVGAVGKITETYDWHICVPVSRAFTVGYSEGNTYNVYFYSSGISLEMKLARIVTEESSDSAVMVFYSSNLPNGFSFMRQQKIKITKRTYEGLYVPASAVRRIDGVDGVYVLYDMRVCFRTVDILYKEDGGYVVAEYATGAVGKENMLRFNDSIIIKGKNLYEGRLIG